MMKKPTPFLLLALALVAVGCNTKTSKSSNSNQYNNGYTSGGYTGTTNGTTTNGTTTNGTTTTGTTTNGTTNGSTTGTMPTETCKAVTTNGSLACSDFDTPAVALPTYKIVMAGHQKWKPGLSPSGNVSMGQFPTVANMSATLTTDIKLSVRFRVKPQPTTTKGVEGCYGRKTVTTSGASQVADSCSYSKLKFQVGAVPLSVFNANPDGYFGNYMIDVNVAGNSAEGVSIDKCTQFYDLPHTANVPHVIVVQEVFSDNACRIIGSLATNCPNNVIVREASCWAIDMQVQTDNFKLP